MSVADSIRLVSHIGVCVSDMQRSIAFYRDALGFRLAHDLHVEGEPSDTLLSLRGVRLHAVYLERDGFRLELLHYDAPRSPAQTPLRGMNDLGFTHLSLQVDDVDATASRLCSQGARLAPETRIEIGGAVVAVFLRDPDGLPIELVRARPSA
jgi:catechol 2,3-dioxygenase-like lactoylglutathione lyase family enzyme